MIYESPVALKKNLLSIISDMQSVSYLFVKQPGKDFSRIRKVSFADTIRFLLNYEWKYASPGMDGILGFSTRHGFCSCLFTTTSKIIT